MNQTMIVSGETVFQIPTNSFAVSPSSSGYLLQYSADGVNFTSWTASTPSNENLMVINGVPGMLYKLSSNTAEVTIRF